MAPLDLVIRFGGAGFGDASKFKEAKDARPLFDVLKEQGVTHIDTAHLYGNSETYLGEVGAGKEFHFDTKWKGGFAPGSVTKDKIIETADESLKKLGVKKVRSCGWPKRMAADY
jgi:aflatoxin B1 aldehyde reductase